MKEYCITWKSKVPDGAGMVKEKTVIHCEPDMIGAVQKILPQDEHEFICVTDQRKRLRVQERVNELCLTIKQLTGTVPVVEDVNNWIVTEEDESDADDLFSAFDEGEEEKTPQVELSLITTYYRKPGAMNDWYDKEETVRWSRRALLIESSQQ